MAQAFRKAQRANLVENSGATATEIAPTSAELPAVWRPEIEKPFEDIDTKPWDTGQSCRGRISQWEPEESVDESNRITMLTDSTL